MGDLLPVLRDLVRESMLDAWALLQPIDCLGCGAPDRACCGDCRSSLRPGVARRIRCDVDPGAPVWCAADYTGPIRGAILALKEDGRLDAARHLAPLLRAAIAGALGELRRHAAPASTDRRLELAPMPTTRRALARRGHDPLRGILAAARLPASRVLAPRRQWLAGEQKARNRAGRLAAAGDRFRATRRLDGRAFLLIDDLATTGASLTAAAAAIRAAGGDVLACVVVAGPQFDRRSIPCGDTESFGAS